MCRTRVARFQFIEIQYLYKLKSRDSSYTVELQSLKQAWDHWFQSKMVPVSEGKYHTYPGRLEPSLTGTNFHDPKPV